MNDGPKRESLWGTLERIVSSVCLSGGERFGTESEGAGKYLSLLL